MSGKPRFCCDTDESMFHTSTCRLDGRELEAAKERGGRGMKYRAMQTIADANALLGRTPPAVAPNWYAEARPTMRELLDIVLTLERELVAIRRIAQSWIDEDLEELGSRQKARGETVLRRTDGVAAVVSGTPEAGADGR